jgi:glucosamine 6-phosphate synthetase-like amidotransferase/phosphosugar isomerase protein
MCGIMGFVKTGETNQKTGEVITKVLRQLQSRGTHATGVSFFKREKGNGISLYAKAPMDAEEFTRTDTYLDLLGGDYSMMLGHTRFATSGSPQINDNNHPHVSDDGRYALVHNGIISRVTGDLKKRCRTECDSEALLRLIERDGIEDGFSRMCRVKTMDYAIMITDGQTDRMYLTRNEARPLCFLNLTEEIGGYLFCSTPEIMLDGLVRAGFSRDLKDRIKTFRPFVLYYIEPGSGNEVEIENDLFDEYRDRWGYTRTRNEVMYARA